MKFFISGRIKPKLAIDALTKIAFVGDTKKFVCSVTHGFPKPMIFWRTSSGYRVPRNYVRETEDGKVVLIFKHVSKSLSGKYTCVGINAAGKTELTAILNVKGKTWTEKFKLGYLNSDLGLKYKLAIEEIFYFDLYRFFLILERLKSIDYSNNFIRQLNLFVTFWIANL